KRMVGSWSTPLIIEVEGSPRILWSMATRWIACDPQTGSLLWFCEGLGTEKVDMVSPTPVVSEGIGVAASGWGNGPGSGVKLGGSGDVTAANRLWLEKKPQRMDSGVVLDRRLFTVGAGPSLAHCMGCQTGRILLCGRLRERE